MSVTRDRVQIRLASDLVQDDNDIADSNTATMVDVIVPPRVSLVFVSARAVAVVNR